MLNKYKNQRKKTTVITNKIINKIQDYVNTKVNTEQPIISNGVICEETGKTLNLKHLLQSKDKHIWLESLSNEYGRLAQGNDRVEWKDMST